MQSALLENIQYLNDNAKIEEAIELLKKRLKKGTLCIDSAKAAKDFCFLKLAEKEHEVFSLIHLDNQHCMIDYEECFKGTINAAAVYPREIVKSCLARNSAAVILAHNHPSGSTEPSEADKALTKQLQSALKLVDVKVLDHLIVGSTVLSFVEAGLM